MAQLHNRISQAELKKLLYAETEPRTTISFYNYLPIAEPGRFRDELYTGLNALKVFGRIYVAHEGINAQVSVPESNVEKFREYLFSIDGLAGVRLNTAVDDQSSGNDKLQQGKSFWVLKIK